MLKRSPAGDFNIPTWYISNSDEIFAGTCFESGPTKQALTQGRFHQL